MRIESNRDSTAENEEAISYYRLSGKIVQSATEGPVQEWEYRTDRHIFTDTIWEVFPPASRSYSVIIEDLGKKKIDWGED